MTVSQLEDEEIRASASRVIRLVLEAGYEDYLEENYTNHGSHLEDLEQLAVFAQQYNTPEEFLAEMALLGASSSGSGAD